MKTIEEKAAEYSAENYPNSEDMRFACEMHFEAGAEWMRGELIRWNDPKQELPDDSKPVEVKYSRAGHISHAVAYLRDHEDFNVKIWMVDCTKHIIEPYIVIGWRPIYDK